MSSEPVGVVLARIRLHVAGASPHDELSPQRRALLETTGGAILLTGLCSFLSVTLGTSQALAGLEEPVLPQWLIALGAGGISGWLAIHVQRLFVQLLVVQASAALRWFSRLLGLCWALGFGSLLAAPLAIAVMEKDVYAHLQRTQEKDASSPWNRELIRLRKELEYEEARLAEIREEISRTERSGQEVKDRVARLQSEANQSGAKLLSARELSKTESDQLAEAAETARRALELARNDSFSLLSRLTVQVEDLSIQLKESDKRLQALREAMHRHAAALPEPPSDTGLLTRYEASVQEGKHFVWLLSGLLVLLTGLPLVAVCFVPSTDEEPRS